MVGAHGGRDEDFQGEEVLGLKGKEGEGNIITTESDKIQKRRWEEKERRTQKSLLIRFPGYHDLECHLSWIKRIRNGSQRRKERRMLQRIPCAEMLDGGILVENESAFPFFWLKDYSPENLFKYLIFTTCRLKGWI